MLTDIRYSLSAMTFVWMISFKGLPVYFIWISVNFKDQIFGEFFFSDFAVMNINWLISEFEERISIFDSFCWWANKIVTSRQSKSKLLSKVSFVFIYFSMYILFFFFVFCIIILLSIAVFISCFTSFVNCLFCFVAQFYLTKDPISIFGGLCVEWKITLS